MLRCVRLKNFVHFEDEQVLQFENGIQFFIGQNNTGKSTVFEAIRRCMSLSKNSCSSSLYDEKQPGTVICVFDVRDTPEDKKHIFISSTVTLPKSDTVTDKDSWVTYLKLAFLDKDGGGYDIGVDLIEGEHDKNINQYELKLSEEQKQIIAGFVRKLKSDCGKEGSEESFQMDEFQHAIQDLYTSASNSKILHNSFPFGEVKETPKPSQTHCQCLLEEHVDKNTVITFALRSICPAQWTNSDFLGPKRRAEYLEVTQKRAEIIRWYVNQLETPGIQEDEKDKENTIFSTLTGNKRFKFENVKGDIVAFEDDLQRKQEARLLTVSEGYFEAKKCSIMLAVNGFKTVCLDDPDRGMHPQMVTRLRDLVLPQITNKVVIIITHNPTFISSTRLLKTTFFQRDEKSRFKTISAKQITIELAKTEGRIKQQRETFSKKTLEIPTCNGADTDQKLQNGITSDETEKETPLKSSKRFVKDHRILTSPQFSIIYFAKRVMFIEGDGDLLFMEEIRRSVVTGDKVTGIINKIIGNDKDMDAFREYLCLMQFVCLHGHTHKARLNSVCKAINLERSFVLDHDALIEQENDKEEFIKRFKAEFDLPEPMFSVDNIIEDITILEQAGIFIWKKPEWEKKGSIEQAIIELDPDPGGELRTFLLDHHVELKFPITTRAGPGRGKGAIGKKFQLFVHPELTATDISQTVEKILTLAAEKKDGEINRLVRFVYNLGVANREQS